MKKPRKRESDIENTKKRKLNKRDVVCFDDDDSSNITSSNEEEKSEDGIGPLLLKVKYENLLKKRLESIEQNQNDDRQQVLLKLNKSFYKQIENGIEQCKQDKEMKKSEPKLNIGFNYNFITNAKRKKLLKNLINTTHNNNNNIINNNIDNTIVNNVAENGEYVINKTNKTNRNKKTTENITNKKKKIHDEIKIKIDDDNDNTNNNDDINNDTNNNNNDDNNYDTTITTHDDGNIEDIDWKLNDKSQSTIESCLKNITNPLEKLKDSTGKKIGDSTSTPIDIILFFESLLNITFTFDPCPYKGDQYFDGLNSNWGLYNWVNPPYSCVKLWAKQAINQLKKGCTSVFLIPYRTRAAYWNKYITKYFNTLFILPPVRFTGHVNYFLQPMCVVVYTPNTFYDRTVETFIKHDCPSIKHTLIHKIERLPF